jgi:predicted nucleic acid-binding protein
MAITSKKIFIDASVLYSFVDRADPNHTQAVNAMQQFSFSNMHLYTSVQAIQDAYLAISRQLGNALGGEFLKAILESNMEILYPQKSDLISAYKLIRLNANKQINLKEAMTAALMQKRGIYQIITFTYWQNLLGSTSYISRM